MTEGGLDRIYAEMADEIQASVISEIVEMVSVIGEMISKAIEALTELARTIVEFLREFRRRDLIVLILLRRGVPTGLAVWIGWRLPKWAVLRLRL